MKQIVLGLSLFAICLFTYGEVRLVEKLGQQLVSIVPLALLLTTKVMLILLNSKVDESSNLIKKGNFKPFLVTVKKDMPAMGFQRTKEFLIVCTT